MAINVGSLVPGRDYEKWHVLEKVRALGPTCLRSRSSDREPTRVCFLCGRTLSVRILTDVNVGSGLRSLLHRH